MLFRPEVLREQQSQWLGTVLLAPKLSYAFATMFAVAAIAGIMALLLFTDYTRKARLNGWLVPELGVMRVFAPQNGVVTSLPVEEGQHVRQGDALVRVTTELTSESLGGMRQEIVERLQSRRASTALEYDRQSHLFEQQMKQLAARLDALAIEQRHLQRESELQRSRVELSERAVERYIALRQRQLVPEIRLQSAEEDRVDQAVKLQALERNRSAIDRERLTLEGERRDLPLKNETLLATIKRNVALLDQEIAEAESRREIMITAPQGGTVTGIQAEPGTSVNNATPLLSIIPTGSKLEAHLFSPSRAIGFVRTGQEVLFRYQAYPYQKFGFYKGKVTSVSRLALNPSEFSQQLAGLTSLYGANEPVYRITVGLDQQSVTAYGEQVQLQPGMQLEADILLETRRLAEWVLDPLYTLTGKS